MSSSKQQQKEEDGPFAISLDSIRAAAVRIEGLAHLTPVLTCRALDAMAAETQQQPALRLFFKARCPCENLQKVGAFKYRGALNAVKKHLESGASADRPTFVTHSSGNHGQALALAARDAGCRAVIIMPTNAPVAKQRAVEGYGATIERSEPTVEAREEAARAVIAAAGGEASARFVHPSNDPDVMSGQGTAGLELLEQAEQSLDAVLVPVGGGGLLSGVAMAVKSMNPRIKVFAVEPEGAADAYRSFSRGELGGHEGPANTIADGLRTTLGDNNWPVIEKFVDDIILVSDDEIVAAMRHIWERMKLVVEPSGAVATAGVLFHKLPADVRNVGVVFSGGNVDLERLPWAR